MPVTNGGNRTQRGQQIWMIRDEEGSIGGGASGPSVSWHMMKQTQKQYVVNRGTWTDAKCCNTSETCAESDEDTSCVCCNAVLTRLSEHNDAAAGGGGADDTAG